MPILDPNYKKAIIDDLVASITANTSRYYAFAAGPVPYVDGIPDEVDNLANTSQFFAKNMLFGKKIANTDVAHVVKRIPWTTNTVYSRFDNTQNLSNSSFYVIVDPALVGGDYLVFKCIDNANGAPSTQKPDQVQASTFAKSDGYLWRYITSISTNQMNKFSTPDYVPLAPNTTIQTTALQYSTIDVVPVVNAGSGYNCYNDGFVRSVSNSTYIQIESNASPYQDFYTKSGIYLFNEEGDASGQLFQIAAYTIAGNTKYVTLDSSANTDLIVPGVTQYKISPFVNFDCDGTCPKAYSTIDTDANSISSVVVIDSGENISRCTATIVSNSSFGVGAVVRPIVPPPGGHGSNPIAGLQCQGMCMSFTFANTQSNTIPVNVQFNKVGILKNPYALNANNTKGALYTGNTFSEVLKCNVSSGSVFAVGDVVTGQTSGAKGTVAFSNSTQLYLAGDKGFANGETIVGTSNTANIVSIGSRGDIYPLELIPIYYQNTNNVSRSGSQSEQFRVIFKV